LTPRDQRLRRGAFVRLAAAIVVMTVLTQLLVLSTPGYYSHDDWDRFDAVTSLGWGDYARAYGALQVGPNFGHPVRPLGMLQQGATVLLMRSSPFATHLPGVILHALVAVTFAWVLFAAGLPIAIASLAAALFAVSPLAALAAGWVAATFDPLYLLFALLAAGVVVRRRTEPLSVSEAVLVMLAVTLALLSKETAIMAAAAVLLLGLVPGMRGRRIVVAALVAAAPIVAYLAYRADAIVASLASRGDPLYTPSLAPVGANAILYFAFPFLLRVDDLSGTTSAWQIAVACLVHVVLVAMLMRRFGARIGFAYLCAYFVFLLPILTVRARSAHYLYAAAPVLALALALLFHEARRHARRTTVGFVIACAVLLLAHTVRMQLFLYEAGRCQSAFLASVDALLRSVPRLRIAADGDVPLDAGRRAVHQRVAYQLDGRPRIVFEGGDAGGADDARAARMTRSCTVELR